MSSQRSSPGPPPLPTATEPSAAGGGKTAEAASASSGSDTRQTAKARVGGTIRGKWRLDKLLGVGGMAAVYAATHRNGARAALKILHPELAHDEGIRSRFVREGYVANRVDHPGRVAVLDDDLTEQGAPFLVMELLEGQSLRQRMKRETKLPVVDALRIAADVLDTLDPFHREKVIHRDLKPGNIYLTHAGEAKLLDFGVAQLREAGTEATMAGTALGTPWYMAPEQAQGKTDSLDGRADIFAMGALLYALLSGKRLWHGKKETEALIMAATQPAPSLARAAPDLPVEVIAAVDKALQWDKRNRFQTAGEMRDTLRGLLAKFDAASEEPVIELSAVPSVPPPAPAGVHPARRPSLAAMRSPQTHTPAPAPAPAPTPAPARAPAHARVPARAPAIAPSVPPLAPDGIGAHTPSQRMRVDYTKGRALEPEETKLEQVFRRMDRLLKAIRHYGTGHPEAASRFHGLHEAMISVLRVDPDGLAWEVQPYCFTHHGELVWEPEPPLDVIPYNLYVSGLKHVRILPGVTEEELRAFCEIITLDPYLDAAREVDIAGAIWEAELTNIPCEISDDLGAFDAAEEESFWAEADDVVSLAREDLEGGSEHDDVTADVNRAAMAAMVLDPMEMLAREDVAEAAAMALARRGGASGYVPMDDALRLDPASATTMATDLNQPPDRWRDRFLDLAIDALADAAWRGDEAHIWDAFGSYAMRCARVGAFGDLLTAYAAMEERLRAYQQEPVFAQSLPGLTCAMFSGPVLQGVAKLAAGVDDGTKAPGAGTSPSRPTQEQALRALKTATSLLDARVCDDCLTLAQELPEGDTLDVILEFIERHVAGQETYFAERLEQMDPKLAHRVMAMLAQTGTQAGVDLVNSLLRSYNPVLRCEAMALLAESDDALKNQLLGMIDALEGSIRRAALSTMVRHQVRAAGPGLVRAVEDEGFRTRPVDAQRELVEALHELHPRRAEEVATAIVRQHGLMKDEALERTRTMAAELLGEWGETEAALGGLRDAMARRWWNSEGLRTAATAAAGAVAARITKRAREEKRDSDKGAGPS